MLPWNSVAHETFELVVILLHQASEYWDYT